MSQQSHQQELKSVLEQLVAVKERKESDLKEYNDLIAPHSALKSSISDANAELRELRARATEIMTQHDYKLARNIANGSYTVYRTTSKTKPKFSAGTLLEAMVAAGLPDDAQTHDLVAAVIDFYENTRVEAPSLNVKRNKEADASGGGATRGRKRRRTAAAAADDDDASDGEDEEHNGSGDDEDSVPDHRVAFNPNAL